MQSSNVFLLCIVSSTWDTVSVTTHIFSMTLKESQETLLFTDFLGLISG